MVHSLSNNNVSAAGPPAAAEAAETAAADPATDPVGLEALACISCRSRKLKCDRTKPACARCARLKSVCAYPPSRRKPAFKRRNVKELEERLAQVEVLLKDAADKATASGTSVSTAPFPDQGFHVAQDSAQPDFLPDPGPDISVIPSAPDVADDAFSWEGFGTGGGHEPVVDDTTPGEDGTNPSIPPPFSMPDMDHKPRAENAGATRNELLGLGLFETLPPTEMIEDLHQEFFTKQHPLIPIIHPSRYMQAFYSGPHLRPPMALTYAIWTMAANGHEKYSAYHDVFHRRARHYLEEDELKGEGEHFITVSHAQAWALISTDEARCMWFTRAAMSSASCIKLLHMMGLHRLDDPDAAVEMAPTIAPPRDWTELEERRRVFWGALCIDSHAAISTGWPSMIDMNDVTTHLPSSEEAFAQCQEEETCRLEDVFSGSPYSSFAAAAIICHIFMQIMKHVHRSKPSDCPYNFEHGPYWIKHRELDNLLSSAFMFLPERFRLPKNVRDPAAVHTNLNLHASVMCLHNSAYEMAKMHDLPKSVRQMCKDRLLMASQEVVNIVKLTSHANAGYRSPLVALALYVASSVYITMAQDGGLEPTYTSNLEFLLIAMGAIGRQHIITKSFLRQALLDLQRGGLLGIVRIPRVDIPVTLDTPLIPCGGNIPLFARSRASRHTDILPPMPGKLPLNNPAHPGPLGKQARGTTTHWSVDTLGYRDSGGEEVGNANKRKRGGLSPDPVRPGNDPTLWLQSAPSGDPMSSGSTPPLPPGPGGAPNAAHLSLPHRAGSSTGSSPSAAAAANSSSTPASTTQPSSGISPEEGGSSAAQMAGAFGTLGGGAVDLSMFQGLSAWDVTGDAAQDAAVLYAQVTEAMRGGGFAASPGQDGWMLLNEAGVGGQASWDTGLQRGGG